MSKTQEAYDYFVSQGWTKEQSAGIVGNLLSESKLDHTVYGDSGKAYGIGQWHPDRQNNFLLQTGKTIQQSTFQEQLAFVNYELTSGAEKVAGAKLKAASTSAEAAATVAQYYERPASKDYSERIANAASILGEAGTTALSGVSDLYAAVRDGKTITFEMLSKVFTAPATAAGGVATGAVDGVKDMLNFDIGSWLTKNIGEAFWDSVKDKLVVIGIGTIAALMVAFSVWGMVKDTPAGSAVKAGASFVPGGRLFV